MRKQWETQNPGHSLPVAGQGPGARNPRAHSADTKALAIHLKTPARASIVVWLGDQPQRPEDREGGCDAQMCPGLLPAQHIAERHRRLPARDYLPPTGCGRRATRAVTPKSSHRATHALLPMRDGTAHPASGQRLDRSVRAEENHKVDATLCEWR